MRVDGFTLLEVLIALVIFSFGLLALAALMTKGLQFNTSSLHRSYASTQAYDIADRMRANRLGLESPYYYGDIKPPAGDPPTCQCNKDCSCETAEAMATFDAWQWNYDNATLLPSGGGTVEKSGSTYRITVTWDDDRDGDPNDSFIFKFQP
ncbi:MAG TPA: type IV pilus modification protein PilV [Arenicellales bacterium]|nr:type IV pilus modification protein PilV [Arenicellales bacterium]